MYEIKIGDVFVEVDWETWRTLSGARYVNGQPYTGPVMPVESENDNDSFNSGEERAA